MTPSLGTRTVGPLGLQGAHREMAELIRLSERLAVRKDHKALRDAAGQLLKLLLRHVDEERASFKSIEPAQFARLVAGQQTLIDSATRFAIRPVADAGADLLALLVRQADIEEAVVLGDEGLTETLRPHSHPYEFSTDWVIAAPIAISR